MGLPMFRVGGSPTLTSDSQGDQVTKTCAATIMTIPGPIAAFSGYCMHQLNLLECLHV